MEWGSKDHTLFLEEILTMGHLEHEEIMENLPNKLVKSY